VASSCGLVGSLNPTILEEETGVIGMAKSVAKACKSVGAKYCCSNSITPTEAP
jgi:hypothetical protein